MHLKYPVLLAIFLATILSQALADGFFRVEERDGHWQVIDPSGQPFHMRGCNHYGDGTQMPWNLKELYGDRETWRQSLRDRHREWGFTYLPPSIGPNAIDPKTVEDLSQATLVTRRPEWSAAHFAELDYPFTAFLEVGKQYMAGPGMPDVFSKAFADAVEARCQEFVAPLRENRNLIGYHFCHNPPWSIVAPSAEQWIEACTQPGSAGLAAWTRLMRQIYGTIDRWREVYGIPIKDWDDILTMDRPLRGYVSRSQLLRDKEAFLQRICERWHQVYHDAIRRHDPNHLILGDRNTVHLQPTPAPWAYHIMRHYLDVLSVNVMGPPATLLEVLEPATRNWDGPILLADTGAGVFHGDHFHPAKSAYQTKDLAEYEEVYAGLMKLSVDHPQIIGFGWCGWFETNHPGGRSGLIDVATDEPLPDLLPIVRKWNQWMDEQMKPVSAQRFGLQKGKSTASSTKNRGEPKPLRR
jgi:hypothetical protein